MNQPRPNQSQQREFSSQEIQSAIRNGGNALVKLAEEVGRQVKREGLTTSQIRNIYGMVKKMEMRQDMSDWHHELVMLKPKMAYAAARASGEGAKTLARVLSEAINAVGSDREMFKRFVDLFEAILAYHKAAGGK